MKTNVTGTSIESYRLLESEAGQVLQIAAFLEQETKHGRAHSIRTIATHFYTRGNQALGQISSVSARLAVLKKDGIIYDGRKYELSFVRNDKNPGPKGRTAEFYFLTIEKKKEKLQMELF